MKKFFTLGITFMVIGAILLAGGIIGSAINDVSNTIKEAAKLNNMPLLGTTVGLAFMTIGGIMLIIYAALVIKQSYDNKKEVSAKDKPTEVAQAKVVKVQEEVKEPVKKTTNAKTKTLTVKK